MSRIFIINSLFFLVLSGIFSDSGFAGQEDFGQIMIDAPKAYVLDKGRLEGSFFYEQMEDGLEFSGIEIEKDKKGATGRLQSYGAVINFGLARRLMLSYSGRRWKFGFENKELVVLSNSLGLRLSILDKDSSLPFSLGLNFNTNRPVKESTGDITRALAGTDDETISFSLMFGREIIKDLAVHGFIGLEKAIVDPYVNRFYQRNSFRGLLVEYRVLKRINFQFSYKYVFANRKGMEEIQDIELSSRNNIFNGRVTYFIKPFLAVNFQGKLYSDLFVGEIPFMFRFTSSFADKNYGYLGLGITFIYDYSK